MEDKKGKKLCDTAEMWQDGLFLTAWGAFFWAVFDANFGAGRYTWELINSAVHFYVAFRYIPEKIDFFLVKKEEEKDAV
jgi:hypothetical protein